MTKLERIYAVLIEHGSMTMWDIVEETGFLAETVASALYSMRHGPSKLRIHIASYTKEQDKGGVRVWSYPQFAAGEGKPARRPPKKGRRAIVRQNVARKKLRVRSVFDLGRGRNDEASSIFDVSSGA